MSAAGDLVEALDRIEATRRLIGEALEWALSENGQAPDGAGGDLA